MTPRRLALAWLLVSVLIFLYGVVTGNRCSVSSLPSVSALPSSSLPSQRKYSENRDRSETYPLNASENRTIPESPSERKTYFPPASSPRVFGSPYSACPGMQSTVSVRVGPRRSAQSPGLGGRLPLDCYRFARGKCIQAIGYSDGWRVGGSARRTLSHGTMKARRFRRFRRSFPEQACDWRLVTGLFSALSVIIIRLEYASQEIDVMPIPRHQSRRTVRRPPRGRPTRRRSPPSPRPDSRSGR